MKEIEVSTLKRDSNLSRVGNVIQDDEVPNLYLSVNFEI